MEVYHLGLTEYARQLTGEGARLNGGRWNLLGFPCIYACESKALCALEFAANILAEEVPEDLSFTVYEIPGESVVGFAVNDLPSNWKNLPPAKETQAWGTEMLNDKLVIRVPSVIVPSEFNFVINPLHPDFKKVRIKAVEPFTFDPRIKQ